MRRKKSSGAHLVQQMLEEKMRRTKSFGAYHKENKVFRVGHCVISLRIIIAANRYLKQALVAAAIMFQSALFGMYCRFTVLVAVDATVPAAATAVTLRH
nr:plastidal glycolate/glycerate translocator 1, chloroplastic [Tanacetum cinerariifolium]GEX43850.1 plastidal glycolate/glycerate translocator 1, chloroplastic [Tanacetum cinerariifolium]